MLIKVTNAVKQWVPGYVYQQRPFNFSPLGFSVQPDENTEYLFPKSLQEKSVNKFIEKPFASTNFIITGYNDDSKALYLAAYLLQRHVKAGGKNPLWVNMSKVPQIIAKPSILVLSNLTADSSKYRLERARDLIYEYYDIPKLIVACGFDPLRFGALRLHVPVNKMVYFKSGLDAQTVVIE